MGYGVDGSGREMTADDMCTAAYITFRGVHNRIGWDIIEAENLIREKRPVATFWPEYRNSAERALEELGYI